MTTRRFVFLGCLPVFLACAHLACFGDRESPGERTEVPADDPQGTVDQPVASPNDVPGGNPSAIDGDPYLPGTQTPAVDPNSGTQTPGAVTTDPTTPAPGPVATDPTNPTPGPTTGTTPPAATCPAGALLTALGRANRVQLGAMMTDDVATGTNWDMRYMYLAGGLFPGDAPCTSCGSCSGDWWGCWQDPALAPGQYVRDFISRTSARGQLPLITYYEFLSTSGLSEGAGQVAAVNDAAKMRRFFNDWRFLLQTIGQSLVLLHIEPDLWGYAQQVNSNPAAIPAAVRAANPTDCGSQQDSFAGFGKCLVSMVRKYAPNAKVGVHASAWGSGTDAMQNRNASLDIDAIARRTADFLLASGGQESDFVVMEVSDRDAGWYELQGQQRWFDANNQTLPHYAQAFRWAKALTSHMNKAGLWWQVPVGNMGLPNTHQKYRDNRVDYILSHLGEIADTGAFGVLFGAGLDHQTNPSTDNGNLVTKAKSYLSSAGQPACR